MLHPVSFVQHLLSPVREPRLEIRLLQLLCLVSSTVSALILPANLLQHMSTFQNLTVLLLAVGSLALYLASIRGYHYMKAFTLLLILVMDLCWYTGGGSLGSMAMFFFLGILVIATFFRGRFRWLLVAAFLANVAILFALDYQFPEWIIPFRTPLDRFLDLLIGSALSLIAAAFTILVVLSGYDEERKNLEEANERLQRNLDEIHTLRGLLPICAWCKSIRNDLGLWTQVEQYLSTKTELSFTQGLCPECAHETFTGADSQAEASGGTPG